MEFEVPQRPQTVGALPKVYSQNDVIVQLLHEIKNEARGPSVKPKPTQKNFMKENLRKLKDIQAQSKQRLAEKEPLQPLKVLNHYDEVQPKILKPVLSEREGGSCRVKRSPVPPRTAGALRRLPPAPSPCPSSDRQMPQKYKSLPDLNRASQTDKVSEFLEDNSLSPRSNTESDQSAHSLACSKKKVETKSEHPHRLGQIPNYLTERKKEWERERRRQLKLRELACIPAGHILLPDEERIETLELLKKNQDELLQSLAALPVRNDTIRLRTYKEELERQLAKVEEGIKIFSRPKVLIKNDA